MNERKKIIISTGNIKPATWKKIHAEERKEKLQAQEKLCFKRKSPMFISADGKCYSCERDILDHFSLKQISSEVITGCPMCHISFVE